VMPSLRRGFVDSAMPTTRSEFTSIYLGVRNEFVNSKLQHTWQLIPVSNRYSVLSCLPELAIGEDEMAPVRSQNVTQPHINFYNMNKEPRGVENQLNIVLIRKSWH
jgi:hypothetical protein